MAKECRHIVKLSVLETFRKVRAGKTSRGPIPKLPINFEEILLRAIGNFKEKNKFLESSVITINYCIIVINVCYITNA